jgi:outer membrane murein-binding lipoprotein Lpp
LRDAPVHGANALQIDYADPGIAKEPEAFAPVPRPRRQQRVQPPVQPADSPTTVAPPAPMALPRAPFLILVVAMVIVGVLGVLVLNTKINENSFALDDLQAQQQALDLKEQQLSQDLQEAQSPGNLRAAAKRLGLVPAGKTAYITLPDGKVVGVPTPATATAANADR